MANNDKSMGVWTREITKNNRTLSDLTRAMDDNKNSFQSLSEGLLSNTNVVSKLTTVLKKSEQLQLQSLAQGTTYQKFVDANTKAIHGSMATQQEMTEALLTGFSQGLRNNTDELNSLLDEMIITGQNTKAMTLVMSNFGSVTGDSLDAQRKLVKVTDKVGKTYGISSERLGQSMASLQSQLEDFSIYGQESTDSLAAIKTSLVGMTGGKPAAERNIDILLKMSDSLNISQQSQLGLLGFSKELRDGTLSAEKARSILIKAGDNLRDQLKGSDEQAQALSEVYGRQQTNALLNLSNLLKKDFKLTDEMKKSAEDDRKSLADRQRSIDKWYQSYAPEIHGMIVNKLPLLIAGAAAARFGMNTSKTLRGSSSLANIYHAQKGMGVSKMSALRNASMTGGGSYLMKSGGILGKSTRLLGLLGGPIGIGITALAFLPDILAFFKKDTKANEDTAKTLKEMQMASDNPGFADRGVLMAARIASEAVRGPGGAQTQDQILAELKRLNRAFALRTSQTSGKSGV